MTYNGGLATVTTTEVSDGRWTLKVGDVRVLDLVGKGKDLVIECKGAKRDPVRADPKTVISLCAALAEQLGVQPG